MNENQTPPPPSGAELTGRKCSRCGASLPADAPEGLCPRCLMALNLAAPTEEFGPAGTKIVHPRPEPPQVAEIAKLFPQLEITGLLGRGGMGFVYKARQPRLDRFVALKILAPDPENRGRFAERFQREAQALAKLSHPNIVSVYDFGETGGYYFLLMEFVDGVNLRDVIINQKMKPQEALGIVPAICDALQFAHSHGVVHRDIKPENILLDKQGRVKIADFGIAKILGGTEKQEALTGDQQAIGTPHYMAPEQIEKPTEVDHRADIYSLGVVFYEMLTGELPLGKFAPPSKKVQVDVRLDEVVLHALEKEPARRYQKASDVKTDLESIASGKGAPAFAGAPAPFTTAPAQSATSDKTILPAFLLAFFLGVFGAHRFYVGKITSGIFQLLTLGGCGIWSTVDWILLVCKAFTDGQGRKITEWLDANASPTRTASTQAPGVSSSAAALKLDAASLAALKSKVTPPAIGLLVAAGVKLFSAFAAGAVLMSLNPFLGHIENVTGIHLFSPGHAKMGFLSAALTFVPSVFVLIGALKMLRLQNYNWAMAAAILAIVFPPLHLVGIPIGIWALVILCQQDVRNAFAGIPPAPSASPPGTGPSPGAGRSAKFATIAIIAVVLCAAAVLAWAIPSSGVFAAGNVREELHFDFPLAADGRFSLENVNGRIAIIGTTNNAVVLTAVKHGRGQGAVDAVKIETNAATDHVSIHTRHPQRLFGWKDNVAVDYTVEVPQGARIDKIESVNGDVSISGVYADISASSVNGTVRTTNVMANLKLSTVNGRIGAEISKLRDGQSVSLQTVNGKITAVLPFDADATVSGDTLNGSITSDFRSLSVKKDHVVGRHVSGTLGNGGAKLKLSATNGGISIRRGIGETASRFGDIKPEPEP